MVQPLRADLNIRKDYEQPLLRKLTLQQAKDLVFRIKNIFFNPHSPRTLPFRSKAKPYQKPSLTTLTPEEAKLLLVGRANLGDEKAADLLYLLFHDQKHLQPIHKKDAS
jgi:hypothetical protein